MLGSEGASERRSVGGAARVTSFSGRASSHGSISTESWACSSVCASKARATRWRKPDSALISGRSTWSFFMRSRLKALRQRGQLVGSTLTRQLGEN